jgi:hypothetical protein
MSGERRDDTYLIRRLTVAPGFRDPQDALHGFEREESFFEILQDINGLNLVRLRESSSTVLPILEPSNAQHHGSENENQGPKGESMQRL